jgi:hypothetical protein
MKGKWSSASFIAFILVLVMVNSAEADLQCEARSGSCQPGYVNVFQLRQNQLRQNDNSHGSWDNSYNIKICCRDLIASSFEGGIGACSGSYDVVLRLSGSNNAHAEKNTMSTSGYTDICIKSNDPRVYNVDCTYTSGSCDSGYVCLAKISGDTNAHLSDCSQSNGYENICCRMDVDTSGPTTTIDPDGHAWTENDVGFTLTCDGGPTGCLETYYRVIDDGQSCPSAGDPSYSPGPAGTVTCPAGSTCKKRVCFYGVDGGGNTETPKQSIIFYIDKEAPETTPIPSGTAGGGGWWRSDVDVMLSCDDKNNPVSDGSGCDETWYCDTSDSCTPNTLGNLLTFTDEGINYVRFYSIDNLGNTENTDLFTVMIDRMAPTTSDDAPSGWQGAPVTVTLTPSDPSPGSGLSWTRYCTDTTDSCDPLTGTDYTAPATVSNPGTTYFRYASQDVAGNTQSTVSRAIQIDMQDPTAWVDTLPEWTNKTGVNVFFDISWNGDDGTGSGIAYYNIQYRIYDRTTGSFEGTWTDWTPDPSNPGTRTFGLENPIWLDTHNNDTLLFRIRATDNAGRISVWSTEPYSNTSIDIEAPASTLEDPGSYQATDNFDIIINGFDGESGVVNFTCQAKGPSDTVWVPILFKCTNDTGPIENVDRVVFNCTAGSDGIYQFRCRGTDKAGNINVTWSDIVSTSVDRSGPDVKIKYPDFIWTYLNQFTLTWESSATDIDHYDVYYYDTAWPNPLDPLAWQLWNTYSSSTTSTTFGAGGTPPVNLVEGQTYYINVTSTDNAENQYSDVINVTIDRTYPVIYISITNQDGDPIPPGWIPSGSGVELINITSYAYDGLSGILNNTIEYMIYSETPDHKWLECGEGASPGSSVCSTAGSNPYGWEDIAYDDRTSVRYRILTKDRAGNENITSYYFTVSHPLANFASAGCHIYLGESRLVPVMVRNIQDQADNITLNLTGYPFAEFEYECDPSDCIISTVTRGMAALNVNPYEERTYYVRVMSSEPGEYSLTLNASSYIDPLLYDSHTIDIKLNYPSYFPGLEPWATLLLLVVAGLVYGALSRDNLMGTK